MRAALLRLEQEGLLRALPGGGYVVETFSERDIADAIELRGTLEGLLARLAAERGAPAAVLTEARGVLERIDCSDKGVVFEVTANATAERFAAASLASVSLISHRDDMRGTISCGRRTAPEHVYVTWKPPQNPGAMRIAIAVEFLPKN